MTEKSLIYDFIDNAPFVKSLYMKKKPEKSDIEDLRKKTEAYDMDWVNEVPVQSSLEDFRIKDKQHRYTVKVGDVPFECLYFPSDTKRLIISLNGGGAAFRRYPNYLRWKHKNYYNGHFICIDDPMYHFHPGTKHVMWYYGDRETSYLKYLVEIVEKITEQLGIPRKNVFFLGSSGGGTAALFCANLMDDTNAVAMNPQIILKLWQAPYIVNHFKEWGIDLAGDDIHNRNLITLNNKSSRFAITSNVFSDEDYSVHFPDFCSRHSITPTYGISLHENIITWVHATIFNNIHSANPEKRGVALMMFLLSKMAEGTDLSNKAEEINALSILLNEDIAEEFKMTDSINNLSDTLSKITYNENSVVAFRNGKWRLLVNGAFNNTFTGVAQSAKGNWIFVKNGIFDPSFTGAAKSVYGNWLYCKEGRFDRSYAGIARTTNGNKILISNGRWQKNFTGLYENCNIKEGYVI